MRRALSGRRRSFPSENHYEDGLCDLRRSVRGRKDPCVLVCFADGSGMMLWQVDLTNTDQYRGRGGQEVSVKKENIIELSGMMTLL